MEGMRNKVLPSSFLQRQREGKESKKRRGKCVVKGKRNCVCVCAKVKVKVCVCVREVCAGRGGGE